MNDEIECLECGWMGDYSELHCSEEDDKSDKKVADIKFNCCPDCGACDQFESLDEDD